MPSNLSTATDLTQTGPGLATNFNKRLDRNTTPSSAWELTSTTSTTSVLGLPACTPGNIILGSGLALVQYFSYEDPLTSNPPIRGSLNNVSAVRIG